MNEATKNNLKYYMLTTIVLITAFAVFSLLFFAGCAKPAAKGPGQAVPTTAEIADNTKKSTDSTAATAEGPAQASPTKTAAQTAAQTQTAAPNRFSGTDTVAQDLTKLPSEGIITSDLGVKCPAVTVPDNVVVLPPSQNADGKNEVVINELNTARLVFSDNYQLARSVQLRCLEAIAGSNEFACNEFLIRKYVSGDIAKAEYAYFKVFNIKITDTITEKSSLTGRDVQKIKFVVTKTACAKADVKEQLK